MAAAHSGVAQRSSRPPRDQGCQMAYFQTQNPNLGNFWREMQYVYFMAIWYILWLFGIFSLFGIMYQEKSGNSGILTGSIVLRNLHIAVIIT
jgi:hypothetical protein